jgi:ribosomal protein S18 acetylase RimI-like enzyme
MLRGWDEGFEIPSLGIAILPDARGTGLGTALMHYLHAEATRRGVPKVRLTVHEDNARAVALYRSLGYEFDAPREGVLTGFKPLSQEPG